MNERRRRKIINAIRRQVPYIVRNRNPLLPPGLTLGRHTYGFVDPDETFPMYTEGARIVVGAFCSISSEARVLGGGEHTISRASTFPLRARLSFQASRSATAPLSARGP
jgi:hypothetical protein